MNKLFVSLLLLVFTGVSTVVRAQDFSGTMTWSARIELTDPQARDQLAMAESALKNPTMMALLKENQQLRGMLEKELGTLNPDSGATSVLPTGFTLQVKGPRALVKTQGGLVSREVLTLGDKNAAYLINRPAHSYEKLSAGTAASSVKTKIVRTTETAQIIGYNCRRFLVETDDSGAKSRFSVWTTTEIKGLNTAALQRMNWSQDGGTALLKQIEGVPLKIDAATPEAKIALTATRITPEVLDGALFTLPPGFKEVQGSSN